ncbi:hypothetical protein Tco_0011030 [Tanacetum coccineum]
MEILVKTCLMPLALKTQNDSFTFVHEHKQEMHADLKYVESLEDEIDKLESDKAEFSNMYDILLQECVTNDIMCSYLQSSSDLDEICNTPKIGRSGNGNPELTSYISCASEVPLGTHVDVQATNFLLQEMFSDENAHHIPSLPANKIPYTTTTPQPNSLQTKAKKLMQKAKKNMRKINFKKTNTTHPTNQKLYDTLYEYVCLDHDAINAQDVDTSFHKRSHDNQDPPNNREGENKKERTKDVGEPCSRSARQNKSLMVHAQVHTPAIQPLDPEDEYIRTRPDPIMYTNRVSVLLKKTTCLKKSSREGHLHSRLEGAGLEKLKQQYKNDVELEYHVEQLKAAVVNRNGAKKLIVTSLKPLMVFTIGKIAELTSSKQKSVPELKETRSDDNEYKFSYADLPKLGLNDVKDMYLLQVQDKLHHLPLEFVKDFNNAFLLFIRRVVIQNRVEDIQLGMKSYQQTLNLTKPMMFFEGIGQKIPFTKSGTHKGIRENLVDIVKKNKLGTGNKRLKGRDWTDIDVEKSNGMVDKIYKTLKRREQLQETRGVC